MRMRTSKLGGLPGQVDGTSSHKEGDLAVTSLTKLISKKVVRHRLTLQLVRSAR